MSIEPSMNWETREMTQDEINEMVRIKQDALNYVQDNMGLFCMPFRSCNDEMKYWREVQSGKRPKPRVGMHYKTGSLRK